MLSCGHVKSLAVIESKKLANSNLASPNLISVDITPYSLFSSFNLAKVQKITLKHVAEEAGVSRMTVSLALRGHAKISEATKKKVRRAADALGYVPNPHLSALGAHIRSSKQKALPASLAYLCHTEIRSEDILRNVTPSFEEEFFLGAARRASALGFVLDRILVDSKEAKSGRLNNILLSRGIMGLVVWRHWVSQADWKMDWHRFAVCSLGVSLDSWSNQLVECDRHHGMVELVRRLQSLGYRRPGLALLEDQDLAHGHIQRSIISNWQLQLPIENRVEHLIEPKLSKRQFWEWLEEHQPDVVIAGLDIMYDWLCESGRSVPLDIGLVRPQIVEKKGLSGIRFNHESLGATAVDLVASQIYNNETTRDDSSKRSVVLRGEWSEGESLRKQA